MRVLILQTGSLNDVFLTTPLIRCMSRQIEGVVVDCLVRDAFVELIRANPYVTNVFRESDGFDFSSEAEAYDHVIKLNVPTGFASFRTEKFGKVHRLRRQAFAHWLYTNLKMNWLTPKHLADRIFETVGELELRNDGLGIDCFIPENSITGPRDLPVSHHLGYIAIAIGSGRFTKRMPVEKLRAICSRIDHPIVLLGDAADRNRGDEIASLDTIKIYNACGKFSLPESCDLIKKSKCLATHDIGLMQAAAAFDLPLLLVLGSTTIELGHGPYFPTEKKGKRQRKSVSEVHIDVAETRQWCRPCTISGRDACPLGHFKCMKKQDDGTLANRILNLIKSDEVVNANQA